MIANQQPLPDFLIVGALKAGTTALHNHLAMHPNVFLPPQKETWFWSFKNNPPCYNGPATIKPVSQLSQYISIFKQAKAGQILGEVCPVYLYFYHQTINNLFETYGQQASNIKIIIILRHPALRAYSHYNMHRRDVQEPLLFEDAIDPTVVSQRKTENWSPFYNYIDVSRYADQVSAYLTHFNNVLILTHNMLVSNPINTFKRIYSFLNIPTPKNIINPQANAGGEPKRKGLQKLLVDKHPAKEALKKVIPLHFLKNMKQKAMNLNMEKKPLDPNTYNAITTELMGDIVQLERLTSLDLSMWKEMK